MKIHKYLIIAFALLTVCLSMAGCIFTGSEEPCIFTPNTALTAYRLPDITSDVFGMVPGGTYEALAWTADGWVGFDPGIAQAGNVGLAHHRWVQLNAIISPSCLDSVDLVTLADVMADMAASGH